jgi:FAD/FMN-containing dehydrogenase
VTGDLNRRKGLALLAGGAGALLVRRSYALSAAFAATQRHLQDLQRAVRGKVTLPGASDYDRIRHSMVWNRLVADLRPPAAIVAVTSPQDVAAAISFARARGLRVSLRSGGHNYQGAALRDGSLLLDLSGLSAISVDGQRRRASVGPGVKGGVLASVLSGQDLAFPVGHCSDVALGGYLLNGGWGWNTGEWGPACMSVVGVELVTASGELLYANDEAHSDLFWAARGAGPGFFAVITRFDLALKPVRRGIHTFAATFPLAATPSVGKWLAEIQPHIHHTVELACTLGPVEPGGPALAVVAATSMAPTAVEAHARIAPLRKLPRGLMPVGAIIDQPATFSDIQQQMDLGFPSGKRMAGDQLWSDTSAGGLLQEALRFSSDMPPAPSAIVVTVLGGSGPAPPMPSPREAALLSASGGTYFGAYAFWDDPAADVRNRGWVKSVLTAMNAFRKGRYVGDADLSAAADRVQECYSPEAWRRLGALKKKYDPTDLFYSYLTS